MREDAQLQGSPTLQGSASGSARVRVLCKVAAADSHTKRLIVINNANAQLLSASQQPL